MRKTETRTIGGLDVTSIQLPSTRAYALVRKVGKVVAPALGALRGKTPGAIMGSDLADLAPALESLFDKLDDQSADSLMLEALACTSVTRQGDDGRLIKYDLTTKAAIDLAFDGDLRSLLLTIKFALEVNFASFFDGSGPSASASPAPSS